MFKMTLCLPQGCKDASKQLGRSSLENTYAFCNAVFQSSSIVSPSHIVPTYDEALHVGDPDLFVDGPQQAGRGVDLGLTVVDGED
jgi:hypothetical protein